MKHPDASHPISIEPHGSRVTVRLGDMAIADSANPLVMREAAYPPVFYFPPGDVRMEALKTSSKTSHCPYKGDASYYSIEADDRVLEDAVWVYRAPYDAVSLIAGYLAFYADKVSIGEE